MKALISPIQNNFVVQVENNEFEVGLPLYWVDCPDYIVAYEYIYNDGEFSPYIPTPPTAEENKQTAINILQQTDWTSIADIGNPQMSNPYLANQAEFINYRNAVRKYAVYPVEGNVDWPEAPQENWVKV